MGRSLIMLPWIAMASMMVLWAPSTSHAVVTHNRLATNRLATNRLATNRLATNRLATNKLPGGLLTADSAAQALLGTADGRDVYSYIVSCALPAGTDIQATIPGAPDTDPNSPDTSYVCTNGVCVFSGSIGLAPRWADRKLSRSGQGWVTACLLARVNAHDTVEPISMRGSHPALAVTASEVTDFPLQEGAFYGNLFASDTDLLDWNACRGQDQAAGEFGGLVDRDCAEPDLVDPTHTQCGFVYAGDCADYTPAFPTPYACKRFDGTAGFYGGCHAVAGIKKWPHAKTYRQVITTYVKL